MDDIRPRCSCHDLPQAKNGINPAGNQKWRCAVRNVEHWDRYYWGLSGYAYNRRLLQDRRWKALKRMAEREELRSGPL